jgi:hypothetical protein
LDPAITAIIGTVVGALAAGIPLFFTELYKGRKEAAQIKASLVAEIEGLVEIIEYRGYLKNLQDSCEYLKKQPNGQICTYRVLVPNHYSRIYQSNSNKIGFLDPNTAKKIVQFHQLIDAVIQDVVPGGLLHEGSGLSSFAKATDILARALRIGKEISKDT